MQKGESLLDSNSAPCTFLILAQNFLIDYGTHQDNAGTEHNRSFSETKTNNRSSRP